MKAFLLRFAEANRTKSNDAIEAEALARHRARQAAEAKR
jgi:hypothetical protein